MADLKSALEWAKAAVEINPERILPIHREVAKTLLATVEALKKIVEIPDEKYCSENAWRTTLQEVARAALKEIEEGK